MYYVFLNTTMKIIICTFSYKLKLNSGMRKKREGKK